MILTHLEKKPPYNINHKLRVCAFTVDVCPVDLHLCGHPLCGFLEMCLLCFMGFVEITVLFHPGAFSPCI